MNYYLIALIVGAGISLMSFLIGATASHGSEASYQTHDPFLLGLLIIVVDAVVFSVNWLLW